MAGMPLGLFDGVDCWMLEGPMRDAQLVEPAQQLDPIGHDGGPYGQTRFRHQRALLEMSPGVICQQPPTPDYFLARTGHLARMKRCSWFSQPA